MATAMSEHVKRRGGDQEHWDYETILRRTAAINPITHKSSRHSGNTSVRSRRTIGGCGRPGPLHPCTSAGEACGDRLHCLSVSVREPGCEYCRQALKSQIAERNAALSSIAKSLLHLAARYDLAVVVTNHMTTRLSDQMVVPSLGPSWAHIPSLRLVLTLDENGRRAVVDKAVSLPSQSAEFCLNNNGLRDCPRDVDR